jgi:hypothetical protein
MSKILESLKKLLPEENLKEVAAAVDDMLEEAVAEVTKEKEAQMNKELEKAYSELSSELAAAEKIAEQGYEEAFAVITDLRNRLEVQKEEFETTLTSGYEEAYQMILAERAKNSSLEVDLYEEYEKKYGEMKEYFVEMLDKFLQTKGKEMHEQIRRDTINDPRYAEHKVALDRIVDIAADYLSDEDFALATSSKLEEAYKRLEEMSGQIKMMEARNIRLSNEKTKLEESVRHVNESVRTNNKNERKEKAKNVSGRGHIVTEQDTKVIAEHSQETTSAKDTKSSSTLLESMGLTRELANTLAGTKKND